MTAEVATTNDWTPVPERECPTRGRAALPCTGFPCLLDPHEGQPERHVDRVGGTVGSLGCSQTWGEALVVFGVTDDQLASDLQVGWRGESRVVLHIVVDRNAGPRGVDTMRHVDLGHRHVDIVQVDQIARVT